MFTKTKLNCDHLRRSPLCSSGSPKFMTSTWVGVFLDLRPSWGAEQLLVVRHCPLLRTWAHNLVKHRLPDDRLRAPTHTTPCTDIAHAAATLAPLVHVHEQCGRGATQGMTFNSVRVSGCARARRARRELAACGHASVAQAVG